MERDLQYEKTQEAQLARDLILHTHYNLFLTGRAGTGKTTFVQELCRELRKSYVIVAPTGIAALNANGVTLHSLFQLPRDPYIPAKDFAEPNKQLRKISKKEKIKLLENLDLIIVDEVSMVRADLLQALNDRLCQVKKTNTPFAGVQLLLIGDLYQLPPVTSSDWALIAPYYRTPFFFSSPAFKKSEFYFLELQKIYRQSDLEFINILESIRTGANALPEHLAQLNQRVAPAQDTIPQGQIILTALRRQSAYYNQQCLDALESEEYVYEAATTGTYDEKDAPTESKLALKVGAQVMFVRNETEENRYTNGELGIVTSLEENEIRIAKLEGGMPITLKRIRWEKLEYRFDEKKQELVKKVVGTFTQYPIRLAWAITIHKSQGLTFENVRIDTTRIFTSGQLYVALSRCRTLEGIALSDPIPLSAIRIENTIQLFLDYCRTHMKKPEKLPPTHFFL